MNRKKRRKRKSRLVLFTILLIVCAVLYFVLFRTITEKTSTKIIDKIDKYGYTLEKRDSELMKTTFASLKEELSKKDVDYETYGKYISQLFIIDLYTINNKKSRYDVGGSEYVFSDYADSYELKVGDTMYKYVGSKKLKKSSAPEVTSVKIDEITEDTYTYNDVTYDSYVVTASWTYKKDLGYDTEGTINIIKSEDKLSIVSFTPEVEK